MANSLAQFLKDNIAEIINIWERRVLKEVEAARLQKSPAMRNSMQGFLEQLAEELSDGERSEYQITTGRNKSERMGREHGKSRAQSIQYTIDQLIYEYHILRQVLCAFLEKKQPLNPATKEIIIAYIEQAVNDAATEFSLTLKEIQDQLSRTLAHDLRNPIAIAKASAELILRRPDDKKNCIDKAGRITISMDRIDKMIRDLLDATRIKAGEKQFLEYSKCDLDWIVRDVAYEANLENPEKVIIFSTQSIFGHWNEDALRRIIENLVSNAIKYGAHGSHVSVILEEHDHFVTLSVHNEGTPILPQDQKRLFRPFHRSKSVEESHVGWGIGLSVVKTLVEAHNGEIKVESTQGEGTTFTITLPLDPRDFSGHSLHQ